MKIRPFASRRTLWTLILLLAFLSGCDPVARHRALSVVFNTVPAFPEPAQFCAEYEDDKKAGLVAAKAQATSSTKQTIHLPYGEKRCNDCHNEQKDVGGGLILPRNKLCLKCHPDILKHGFIHGPAAEGDCLACHLPHTSSYAALLMDDRDKVCANCHVENRVAADMHARLGKRGMACMDCHDPHSGTSKYFLK